MLRDGAAVMPDSDNTSPDSISGDGCQSAEGQEWNRLLLNSYQKWVGHALLRRTTPAEDARTLFHAPFVVVSHGVEEDPLLNYGNRAALELWEMGLDQLVGTPSRKTAEPVHRDERVELLRRTREFGFIDDYSGVRISSSGRRFQIEHATIWNVVNDEQTYVGQAAVFSDWNMLPA